MKRSFLPRLVAGILGSALLLAAPGAVSARNAAPTQDAAEMARSLKEAGVATSYAQGRGFGRRSAGRGGFGRGGRRGGFARGGYGRGGFARGGYGRGGFRRGGVAGRGFYGRRYGRGFRRGGIGAGAAVGGLAAGALIGGAIASQARPAPGGDAVASCQQRFRSYDPASGTYLGHDGRRHPCP